MIDEALLSDPQRLDALDGGRLLWALATAGAQVRRSVASTEEVGLDRLTGERPRAVLVATDASASAAADLVAALAGAAAPVVAWRATQLPAWAGGADALLVGCVEGRDARLAQLVDAGRRRGLAVAVAAPAGSPVAVAAGATGFGFRLDGPPSAGVWSVLTPLLQAATALQLWSASADLFDAVADALDETANLCRPDGDAFTNPAKALALALSDATCLLAGAGPLAAVAARAMADRIQRQTGAPAFAAELPAEIENVGALLRGPDTAETGGDDFFRDRVDDPGERMRLVLLGDDETDLPGVGPRDWADESLQAPAPPDAEDAVARGAAAAARSIAADFGVGVSTVPVTAGPALARFASAEHFGAFTAAYLSLGRGQDPSMPRYVGDRQ